MQRTIKKAVTLSILFLFAGMMLAPAAFAVSCDEDADNYLVIPAATMKLVNEALPYNENGSYSLLEWQNFSKMYKDAVSAGDVLTEAEICDNLPFSKGLEPKRCDSTIIASTSGVYDTTKVSTLAGNTVNPGAFDVAGNGIDENCDGPDGKLVPASIPGGEKNLGDLTQKVIMYASRAVIVVSILIMMWGGFMYATAAGDETKTGKARKAIIGAIIGLVVGLLAPTIVGYIVASLA